MKLILIKLHPVHFCEHILLNVLRYTGWLL